MSDFKIYFFSGKQYIQVTRADTGLDKVNESGHPVFIYNWQWPDGFGENGIDAALYSGSKCYFFKWNQYVRVTRNGTVNVGHQDFNSPHLISCGDGDQTWIKTPRKIGLTFVMNVMTQLAHQSVS
jgi:hypothetical protein